jgi:hypothetical protein
MIEQVEFLEHLIAIHTSFIIETKTLQKKGTSSFEEPSSAESKLVPTLDSTVEASPEPRTPKERVIHPSEFIGIS